MEHISKYLPAVVNSEPVKQELTRPRIGEDNALVKAILSPMIAKSSVEDISQALRLVMVKVGLRAQNWPSEEEKIVLINHIVENFGGNKVDEIRLAFDMAIAGKLEFGKDESIIPYENFSCLYFSSVMNAYRKWSSVAFQSLPSEQPIFQRLFTQEELEDGKREDAERLYQMFLRGFAIKSPEACRDILVKDGLIGDGVRVVDFLTQKMNDGATNIYVKP